MSSNLFLLFVLFVCFRDIFGRATIELNFKTYRSSCKEDGGTNPCDPMFTFCLDTIKSAFTISPCAYAQTQESGYYQNTLNIDFGSSIKGIPNPWINTIENMPTSIMLVIRIRDDDVFGNDHLATWPTYITEQIYPSKGASIWSSKETYTGDFRITFDVRIYCVDNFYSSNCGVSCKDQDSSTGHYRCDQTTGSKICMKGWTGTNCDQDINECNSNVCNHGTCDNLPGDYVCHCADDYKGINCSIAKTACDSSPCVNNGTCHSNSSSNYSCSCSVFFKGTNCEMRQDPCLISPCKNGGLCSSNANLTNYWCNCTYPYTGSSCESLVANWTTLTAKSSIFNSTVPWIPINKITSTNVSTKSNSSISLSSTTTAIFNLSVETPHIQVTSEDGIEIWIIIVITAAAFIVICLIIFLIVLILACRRRKQKKILKKTQAFENSIYVGNQNSFESKKEQIVPTASTVDVSTNPIKPSCSQITDNNLTNDREYVAMDVDGYIKPPSRQDISHLVERAHSNDYNDLPSHYSLDELHYEELDEIRAEVNKLQEMTSSGPGQEVKFKDKHANNQNYSDVPSNNILNRDASNKFSSFISEENDDFVLPDSKPPTPTQFIEKEEEVENVKEILPQHRTIQNERTLGIPDVSYDVDPQIFFSDPFSDPVTFDDGLDYVETDLPELAIDQDVHVTNPFYYKLDLENEKTDSNHQPSLQIHNDIPVSTKLVAPPPLPPKPLVVNKEKQLVFQNSAFGYDSNKGKKKDVLPTESNDASDYDNDNFEDYPQLTFAESGNEPDNVRLSEILQGLPDVKLNPGYDSSNPLFYKLDFKKDEVEEVVDDDHIILKLSPQSMTDSPASTLSRSAPVSLYDPSTSTLTKAPPQVAPKPKSLNKGMAVIGKDNDINTSNEKHSTLVTLNQPESQTNLDSPMFKGIFIKNPNFSDT